MHVAIKVLAIPLVLFAGFYAPDVIKQLNIHLSEASEVRDLDQYCMLSKQTCIQDAIAITLDKDKVKALVASRIRVKWQQSNSEELMLTMKGLEEQLGTVKYKLKHVGNDYFEGQIILPVCTLDEMTWLGELTDGQKTVYPALRMEA